MFKLYEQIIEYIKRYWIIFTLSIIANALYSAVDAGMIKLLQPLIDDVFVAKDQGLVGLIPIILPSAFLFRGLMSFSSDYGMAFISRQVVTQMRQKLFAHMQRLPATFYDNISSGQILAKLSYNVDQIAKATTDVIVDIVRNSFLVIFLLGVMLITSWKLTLFFMIICPFVVALFRYASKRYRKISKDIQESIASVLQLAEENIEAYKVVRTYNGEDYEIAQFNKETEKNRKLEMKMIVTKAINQPLIQFIGGLGLAFTVFFATSESSIESLSAGEFATLMTSMVALLSPIKQLSAVSSKIQQGMAGLESIYETLDLKLEEDKGELELDTVKGEIVFANVHFKYSSSKNDTLRDINLEIKPGESVAFVGKSGSGKTTLINLLLRFYDDFSGKISIDGYDIRNLKLKSLRQKFALVSQNISLFNDTVANNIAYGRQDNCSLSQIESAAIAANAMDFIIKLPNGFATQIGENGVLLSGGQRQRIAIARAICKNAPILILDEATSALDNESELAIQKAIDAMMQNKTTLIIAHRLSTIEKADKIVVLDDGSIVEIGNHKELLAKKGYYYNLHGRNNFE